MELIRRLCRRFGEWFLKGAGCGSCGATYDEPCAIDCEYRLP